MGAWSVKPWGNDEAADWFANFWQDKDFSPIITLIENFDPANEDYCEFRAACYLLETLGRPYVWPSNRLDDLRPALTKAIEILENMVSPPDENWFFLEEWDNDPEMVEALEQQIAALTKNLNQLA